MNTVLNKFLLTVAVLFSIMLLVGACGEEEKCVLDCQNGGDCTIGQNGQPTCVCPPNYTGDSCQTCAPCNRILCQHGGTCVVQVSSDCGTTAANCTCPVICECAPGYFGEFCENYDTCLLVTCPSNASCNEGNCFCNAGYAGDSCEIVIREQYLGTYQGMDVCTNNSDTLIRTANYSTSIEFGDSINEIVFTNFGGTNLMVTGEITSLSRFLIPTQTFGDTLAIQSDTTGVFRPVGTVAVTLSYTITIAGKRENCEMVLER